MDLGSACCLGGGEGGGGKATRHERDHALPPLALEFALLRMACGAAHRSSARDVAPCAGGMAVRPCAALALRPHGPASAVSYDAAQPQLPWYDTPSYAAPELALGLPPSPASDVWSLAVSTFELATGAQGLSFG